MSGLTATLRVRVDPAMRDAVQAAARDLAVSPADVIRAAILRHLADLKAARLEGATDAR